MDKEKFFAMLWRRFRDLVEKFFGVKGIFVVLVTVGFFSLKTISEVVFVTAWVVFIGGRYVDKFIELKSKLFARES